jgi:hypothetical protein
MQICFRLISLAYSPYFEKMEVGLCDFRALCVYVYEILNGWSIPRKALFLFSDINRKADHSGRPV